MKNLTILLALGLILLTSCSKDDPIEQTELQSIEQNELLSIDSVYVLNQLDDGNTWEAMPIEELINDTAPPIISTVDAANAHTNGHFNSSNNGDRIIISWSGSQNYGGTSGSAEVKIIGLDYSFEFVMETECVTAIGNEAVYGGTISEIRELSGKPPFFDLGWHFYFKVIDYQRGAHQFDKIANMMIFTSPMSPSLCGTSGPSNQIWSSQGYSEVQRPGFVEVSN